jgi:anti-sigma regulatory factor (Ser/Thr protein kinase)
MGRDPDMEPLRLPFDHHIESGSLRHAARPCLAIWQAQDLVDDTLLVISELVQNVIQHTGDGGELAVSRLPDTLLVEVFDHSPTMPRLYPPDPRRVGGRGMLVVDAISYTWGSRPTPTGKVVWASLPLGKPD